MHAEHMPRSPPEARGVDARAGVHSAWASEIGRSRAAARAWASFASITATARRDWRLRSRAPSRVRARSYRHFESILKNGPSRVDHANLRGRDH